MQKLCLRLIVWLAFRSAKVKEPDRLRVFLAETHRPPSSNLSTTHIVMGNGAIDMHEYSQERAGDHYETKFLSLRDFLRHCVHARIGHVGIYYGTHVRREHLEKTGQQLSWDETHRQVNSFEAQLKNQLESFFDSWLFLIITRIGRFSERGIH